ncbi:class I SAM-dependent methyltransferase [Caballeronia concitans]|uniref:Methyltransferase type 11 n=1 Tax=Caballeronia concitans TaxID=1777133 RepID=A0A658QUK0_9BURK|nr:class I SAM-dependent methyltransferase [Caballeronia concitans]KIG09922.1 Methyltransferase type 11 [Burkholderia sp. MR1]SAL22633.1 methyltransferase type 11 [Caballeronia concitans]
MIDGLTSDKRFAGPVPEIYDTYLVPMIFQRYADDIADRVGARQPARVLEVAAGTGVVTRALVKALPASTVIVATDLNPAMLDRAQAIGTTRPVDWRQADAMQLPFADAQFDVVVCQFGAMFFPDKARAFAEVRRVLRANGAFIFNIWDGIEENDFALTVTEALSTLFADDPPMFLARTPHGYHERSLIEHDLRAGGFSGDVSFEVVRDSSRADTPDTVAFAYCQGTPLRFEIEARGPDALSRATQACNVAIAERFGPGPIDGQIQAQVVIANT